VLTIVDDQQQSLRPQRRGDSFAELLSSGLADADGRSDLVCHEARINNWPQLDEPDAVWKVGNYTTRKLDRETCLATATGAE
jgi:hypothetical protein